MDRYLPAQAVAGTFLPIAWFVVNKLATRQSAHKKHQLREELIALNTFIASVNDTARRSKAAQPLQHNDSNLPLARQSS
jgi:hypothetical protein